MSVTAESAGVAPVGTGFRDGRFAALDALDAPDCAAGVRGSAFGAGVLGAGAMSPPDVVTAGLVVSRTTAVSS